MLVVPALKTTAIKRAFLLVKMQHSILQTAAASIFPLRGNGV